MLRKSYSFSPVLAAQMAAALLFAFASSSFAASPFINMSPHPELAALHPVANVGKIAEQPLSAPPELVLSFVAPLAPVAITAAQVFTDVWERIRAGFGIEPLNARDVYEAQEWYAKRPELVANILQRSRYYLFHIVDEVAKRGMPTEIALLPFVESGFDPRAISTAQALGLWQFIPETGTRYGLDQNHAFDARRDIIASTTAALDYLQFLHGLFGDWHLALAAYNWGEKAVTQAIERNRVRGLASDFDSLILPRETRIYVPKLLALKRLIADPSSFGMTLPRIDNEPYFVTVTMPPGVDLKAAARLADMDSGEFAILNAAYSQPLQNSLPMRAIIRADKVGGFFDRVREYSEAIELRGASQAARAAKRGRAAAPPCCQRK